MELFSMINPIEAIYNKIYYSYNNNQKEVKESIQVDSEVLKKAKALLYQAGMKNPDQRALNLIVMAENALKNGNPVAADNFANRAIRFINPDIQLKLNQPENNISAEKYFKPENYSSQKIEVKEKPKPTTHMYKDVSNDAGVSFTYPSSLTGPESFLAVPAHEGEHVARAVSDAVLKGEKVLVTVSYRINYDPVTGEPYMSGGLTRITKFAHYEKKPPENGKFIDTYA